MRLGIPGFLIRLKSRESLGSLEAFVRKLPAGI